MKKHKAVVRIINPPEGTSGYTSLRSAREQAARGWAEFTVPDREIRLLSPERAILERHLESAMAKDREYWSSVARQRGGEQDVAFVWRGGKTGVGSEPWSKRLGFSVMEGRAVPK